jgi:hypothetical protein
MTPREDAMVSADTFLVTDCFFKKTKNVKWHNKKIEAFPKKKRDLVEVRITGIGTYLQYMYTDEKCNLVHAKQTYVQLLSCERLC